MVGVYPVNKHDASLGDRRPPNDPALNSFVYLLSSMSVIGGFLFGYDTGIVSAAMLYLVNNAGMRPINHLWQEWIISVTPAFAAVGSLFAGKLGDKFGRRWLIITSSVVFTAGAIVCGAAPGKWVLLIGRVLLGLAIGVASMIVPVYISECSPTHIRGKMLTYFNILVCFGQMAANVVAGGFSYLDEDNLGWRLMLGFAAIPSLIQLIGFLFLPESPRWLLANVGETECEQVLKRVYNNDQQWVNYELGEISACIGQSDAEVDDGQWMFMKVWRVRHVRKALFVGCSLTLGQQLAGINTIMYYTGGLIRSAGVRDNHTTIWLSVITSGVNFIGNFIPFLLIEKLGRRKVLLTSVATVTVSLVLLGTSFLVINRNTYSTTTPENMEALTGLSYEFDESVVNFEHCLSKSIIEGSLIRQELSNCDYCLTDDRCGYCALKEQDVGLPSTKQNIGLCLPLDPLKADVRSSTGYCASSSNGSYLHSFPPHGIVFEWANVYCQTKFTYAPLILMVVYLLCFSSGYAPLPWVLNAEFYPLWARGWCVSVSTFVNWITNLLISVTFLTLSVAITRYGTFYLYAALTSIAWIIFYKYVPETTNCSLDEIEGLFMSNRDYEHYQAELRQQFQNRDRDNRKSE